MVAVCALLLLQVGSAAARSHRRGRPRDIVRASPSSPSCCTTPPCTPPGPDGQPPDARDAGLTAADEPILAIYPAGNPPAWDHVAARRRRPGLRRPAGGGQDRPWLLVDQPAHIRDQLCIYASQGQGCPQEASRLFQREPVTHSPWVDLLGYRTIVIARAMRQHVFEAVAGPMWHLVDAATPSRSTGDRAQPASRAGSRTLSAEPRVRTLSLSSETQSYDVAASRAPCSSSATSTGPATRRR